MTRFRKVLLILLGLVILLALALFILAQRPTPKHIQYGMSFNVQYAQALGLDWKTVYNAMLDDLKVRHLRLSATWPLVEPKKGVYDFSALDYEVKRAEAVQADVILVAGYRTPRWPECHIPDWAATMNTAERQQQVLDYITTVVDRYKGSSAIKYWQVENEPFLTEYATRFCPPLDTHFLDKEIALVHKLDPSRKVLVTDSGNLGTWTGAYKRGDLFGTSVYVYFWNPQIGQFHTFLPAWFYRVKTNLMELLYGRKPTMLIELSAEPWLLKPISQTPLSVQLQRMDLQKFDHILSYAKATHFQQQYLWGVEWWYWLTLHGHPEMWQKGKTLFADSP